MNITRKETKILSQKQIDQLLAELNKAYHRTNFITNEFLKTLFLPPIPLN